MKKEDSIYQVKTAEGSYKFVYMKLRDALNKYMKIADELLSNPDNIICKWKFKADRK